VSRGKGQQVHEMVSLAHSANGEPFKLVGIPFLVGKIKLKLLFHGPLAE